MTGLASSRNVDNSRSRRVAVAGAAWLLVTLATFAVWWWHGREVALVDAPSERVPCVSYAPFRGNETPFDAHLVVTPARIEDDLRRLAAVTDCVRTYATDQGLAAVPAIAQRLGLQVMLGAWIGRDAERNAAEIERAAALARAFPDTVRVVVVGNEVLLRREQPATVLAELIARTRAMVPVPVTYADVWEFWVEHPELAAVVDRVTIHTLPYWEDEPVAIGGAVDHVVATWREVTQRMPGTPVAIGEAGWPSAGRMRDAALPSRVNQARFVRELLAAAAPLGIEVNLIEAFDQPWKRALEGTVGGHWGLFTSDRQAKFPLQGPVAADPAWQWRCAAASVIALAVAALALARGWRPPLAGWLCIAAGGHLAGGGIALAVDHLLATARTPLDWAQGLVALALALSSMLALLLVRPPPVADGGRPLMVPFAAILDRLRRRRKGSPDAVSLAVTLLRFSVVVGAAATALAIAADPRYRDFPIAVTAVPAGAFALLAWLARCSPIPPPAVPDDRREEALLGVVLVLAAVAIVIGEGLANHQALAFAAALIGLALPLLLDAGPRSAVRRARREPNRERDRTPPDRPRTASDPPRHRPPRGR